MKIKTIIAFALIACVLFAFPVNASNGTTSIWLSYSSLEVGETLNVAVKFSLSQEANAVEAVVNYSPQHLEYVGGDNSNLVDNGCVKIVVSGNTSNVFEVQLEFKAIGVGETNIAVNQCYFSDGIDEYTADGSSVLLTVNKKSNNEVCEKPTVSYYSYNCISLTYNEGLEYSIDGENWQTSTYFGDLAPSTEYKLYQRFKETNTHFAGIKSQPLVFKTADYYENKKGDVNNNKAVDAADLALLKKIIAGFNLSLDNAPVFYDIDNNGAVPNVADLALLKKIIAGLL